jgi:hypothetical protein
MREGGEYRYKKREERREERKGEGFMALKGTRTLKTVQANRGL